MARLVRLMGLEQCADKKDGTADIQLAITSLKKDILNLTDIIQLETNQRKEDLDGIRTELDGIRDFCRDLVSSSKADTLNEVSDVARKSFEVEISHNKELIDSHTETVTLHSKRIAALETRPPNIESTVFNEGFDRKLSNLQAVDRKMSNLEADIEHLVSRVDAVVLAPNKKKEDPILLNPPPEMAPSTKEGKYMHTKIDDAAEKIDDLTKTLSRFMLKTREDFKTMNTTMNIASIASASFALQVQGMGRDHKEKLMQEFVERERALNPGKAVRSAPLQKELII